MMGDLLQVLLVGEPSACEAWARWRAGVNIDELPFAAHQLLPALNPVIAPWIGGDPAAAIFQGIIRKTWSQNQVRLRKAVEVVALLERAGVGSATIAGPVAWSLAAPPGAIRPIPYLTFLLSRAELSVAAKALVEAGWLALCDPLPSGDAMDWSDHISFSQEGLQLYLHWRLIPAKPEDALVVERAFLRQTSQVAWNRHRFATLSREATLLHILCGSRADDVFPWQADAALIGITHVHWRKLRRLASRFCPIVFERLHELRLSGLPIPELTAPAPSPFERKFRYFWSAYRGSSYYRKEAITLLGFLRFLAERCNLSSIWKLPRFVAKRAFQQGRNEAR